MRAAARAVANAASSDTVGEAQDVATIRAGAEAGDTEYRKSSARRMYAKAAISGDGDLRYLHALTRWAAKPPPPAPLPPRGALDGPQPAAEPIAQLWASKWDSSSQRREEALRAVSGIATRAREQAGGARPVS